MNDILVAVSQQTEEQLVVKILDTRLFRKAEQDEEETYDSWFNEKYLMN